MSITPAAQPGTTERHDVDVLVLGAGPTGLTAACLLADAGVSVALVEQHAGSGDEPRAISITDESLRIMDQLGVLGDLAPQTLLDTGARYTGLRGQVLADVRPGRQRLGHPGKSQFDQPVLEGLLWEAAAARPGIELHFGTRVTAIDDAASAITVSAVREGERSEGFRGDLVRDTQVRAGGFAAVAALSGRVGDDARAVSGPGVPGAPGADDTPRTPGGSVEAEMFDAADAAGTPAPTELRFSARWVLACDGGRSFARKSLGIPLTGSTQEEKWIVVDLLGAGEGEPFASFHCNRVRPAVVVPGVNGRRRYEFMLLPGEDEAAAVSEASVLAMVAQHQSTEGLIVRRAAVYTAQQRVARDWKVGRVLLAGDAAHLMPPFAGQGLNAGLRDAAAAAWRLAAVVRGEASEALLESYEAERKPHAASMVKLSKRIGSVVMSTNRAVCLARDGLLPALGLVPRAKAWLTGMKFLKQPNYRDGLAVPAAKDLPAAAAALLGGSLPQPMVMPDAAASPAAVASPEAGGGPESGGAPGARPGRAASGGKAVGLDAYLSSGFVWVGVTAPGRLSVQPQGGPEVRLHTVSAGERGVDPAILDGAVGHWLLVRPDRYVAAVVRAEGKAAALAAFKEELPGLSVALGA
ncbi:MAG: FAD-dependent monooxygenase [Arthrobacter sp.]|jgi:3-(3-hydroxy-phenyl)propionate hydroxylase|nr:FAD-dependent monooxygenase [Arthrobacter sp.]